MADIFSDQFRIFTLCFQPHPLRTTFRTVHSNQEYKDQLETMKGKLQTFQTKTDDPWQII